MTASYLLSRTLVPALAHLLMKNEPIEGENEGESTGQGESAGEKSGKDREGKEEKPGLVARINRARARAFERFEGRTRQPCAPCCTAACSRSSSWSCCSLAPGPRARRWARLLPQRRYRADEDPFPRSHRHAPRGHGGHGRRRRAADPRHHPGVRDRDHQRQRRCPDLAQLRLYPERRHRRSGRGHPHRSQARPSPHRGVRAPHPRRGRAGLPGQLALFPAGRRHQSGPELRALVGDRSPDPGALVGAGLRGRARPRRRGEARAGRGRRADCPGRQPAHAAD